MLDRMRHGKFFKQWLRDQALKSIGKEDNASGAKTWGPHAVSAKAK